ncbi:chitin-binding protein [Pseudomonas sp. URIL14HWK12:I9]|nr:chitinase [Pseudomonas sp. URIL14HWK12:I12]PVZ22471.1 chitinase [Pseudomonas sp. URIL14HWK12:I10]PVZ31405.1 chitinase [Pseudomonas sp. URIL14HWK12:I11]SNZ16181.1 chitin-binding protein [Pseudomonas sp. URIL14HWK12:I9]
MAKPTRWFEHAAKTLKATIARKRSAAGLRVEDAASTMPNIRGKKILMGFWHNWAPNPGGDGYQRGEFAALQLTDVPTPYNVVAVAFMKGHGIPTFKPYALSDEAFRQQVGALNAQGRAVLISLGGADAEIEFREGDEQAFAFELVRLVETYGFDGLDIDLEQSAIKAGANAQVIPAALKLVRDHYAGQGKHFIISMAPEFPYLKPGNAYEPYISGLEGYYDFIAPQFYNQGGDGVWVDELNLWLTQNNDAQKADFLFYLTDSLVHGTRGYLKIPADKFVIGLPSNVDAAATGYVDEAEKANTALLRLTEQGTPVRGLMTWSVNWDAGRSREGTPYGWEFVERYRWITEGGEGPGPDPEPDPDPEPEPEPAQWQEGKLYVRGDTVMWKGQKYLCKGKHTARMDWAPDAAHNLWGASNSQGAPITPAHGGVFLPKSRAVRAWERGVAGMDASIPYSLEAGKFFPAYQTGLIDPVGGPDDSPSHLQPADGQIASAGHPQARLLDEVASETGAPWPTHSVQARQSLRFEWHYSAIHAARRWNYFITRPDWDPSKKLSRAQFESEPFTTVQFDLVPTWRYREELLPPDPTVHEITLPYREGYHVLLAVWEVADTGMAFYQVVDLSFEAGSTGEPGSPSNLRVATRTTSSIGLAWQASTSGTAAAGYEIARDGQPAAYRGAHDLEWLDEGLQPGTAYAYEVVAVDREGHRSQPARVSAATLPLEEGVKPTEPLALHAMGVTARSASLMWGAPATGQAGVDGYRLYRDGALLEQLSPPALTYTAEGLSEGVEYEFFVTAYNASGESVPSNVLRVTPQGEEGTRPWSSAGVSYRVGDQVSYKGAGYRCIQAHVSNSAWSPEQAPTLWSPLA